MLALGIYPWSTVNHVSDLSVIDAPHHTIETKVYKRVRDQLANEPPCSGTSLVPD